MPLLLFCERGLLHKRPFCRPQVCDVCVMEEVVCLNQPAPPARSIDKNVTAVQEVPALCPETVPSPKEATLPVHTMSLRTGSED